VQNQANVALMRHRHDEALALAERSVSLHQSLGSGHGLAVALATLGQIHVQVGDLERAEQILNRALEVRSSVKFGETTGAVFDTLAQIHLMRGSYERAGEYLRLAGDAYGAYGSHTMRWYEWSLKVLGVKLAIRRGDFDEALAMATSWPMRRVCHRPTPSRRTSQAVKRSWRRDVLKTPRALAGVRGPPRSARRAGHVG
jgi:tetratricopeptide (TPR) repeat protein